MKHFPELITEELVKGSSQNCLVNHNHKEKLSVPRKWKGQVERWLTWKGVSMEIQSYKKWCGSSIYQDI